jgi:prepilin-type processing-associated H-X9-DG protein
MFAAGMAATGVVHQLGWLVTSPVPLTDGGGASMAARRAQSTNNLKQITLGFDQGLGADGAFPPGVTLGQYGEMLHGWQALILPFCERADIYNRIDLRRPWDDPANAWALRQELWLYLNPAVPERQDAAGWALSHYEGNVRVLGSTSRLRTEDVIDGTSNTILAGEVAGGFQPWGQPGHWRDPAAGLNRSTTRGFGSPFRGGANVAMMDGSVRFLKDTISPSVLRALGTPEGGERIGPDAY